MKHAYGDLRRIASAHAEWEWLAPLIDAAEALLRDGPHGDLPRWRAALDSLPAAQPLFDGSLNAPVLGSPVADLHSLEAALMQLHPWRKGPLTIGGVTVDTEWRSDWKWARLAPHVDLQGHRILDVGCGNGYYGWRMLGAGARWAVGVDPTLVYTMQWAACRHFTGDQPNFVLPLKLEDLPDEAGGFDSVFSMGVLYHRQDPLEHLRRLGRLVVPGGQIVLETLVLEGQAPKELTPNGRYARMRNVYAVPTLPRLLEWIEKASLARPEVLDITPTSVEEQRSTRWMQFESLAECLDPGTPARTVEGHPAPVRAMLRIPVR